MAFFQPMQAHEGTEIHLQSMEDSKQEQMGVQRRLCPYGERNPCWSSLLLKDCSVEWSHAGASPKELETVRRLRSGEVSGGLYPIGLDPILEQGKEGAVKRFPQCHSVTEEVEESRVKSSLGWKWGGKICLVLILFLTILLLLIGSELN